MHAYPIPESLQFPCVDKKKITVSLRELGRLSTVDEMTQQN